MELGIWSLFFLTSLVTTLSPGPNTLLVMVHASKYGIRASLLTIVANLSSQFVLMLLVIFGFGAVLAQAPLLYFAMKTAGAIYLIYLGVKLFMGARASSDLNLTINEAKDIPSFQRRYAEAFLVSCSNPKTVLFLSALLPQFLDVDANLNIQFSIMYLTNAVVIFSIHALYGYAAYSLRGRIVSARIRQRIAKFTGLTFVSLSFGLMASRTPG